MKKILVIIVIFLAIIFIVMGILSAKKITGYGDKIKSGSVLVLDMSKSYPERGGFDFSNFRLKKRSNFLSLIKAIELAKEDKNILALAIKPFGMSLGRAQLDELSNAIDDFKESGKKVYCYLDYAGMGGYLLASLADSISLAPQGELVFLGISVEPWFFAGTAEKLGIGFDVIQIGEYKGAVEQFTEKKFSKPFRETVSALVDDLFYGWIEEISKRREIPEEIVFQMIDEKGIYSSDEALNVGLIDIIEYPQDFRKRIIKLAGDDEKRLVDVQSYISSKSFLNGSEKIAVIYGLGAIGIGKTERNPFSSYESIGSETMSKAIDDAAKDDKIKAIVIRVDSPGGSALASDIIWKSIIEARQKKPVVVSMGNVAGSGGYYISMGADSIFCDKSTITGSIGVIFMKPYIERLLDKMGVTVDTIIRGRLADEVSLNKPMSPEGKEIFTQSIEKIYMDFTSKAADNRGLSLDSLDKLARGRIWSGIDAVEIGLVDRIADFSEVIEVAGKMAGIEKKDIGIVYFPAEKGFLQYALEVSSTGTKAGELLPKIVKEKFSNAYDAVSLAERGNPLAIMPVVIKFDCR